MSERTGVKRFSRYLVTVISGTVHNACCWRRAKKRTSIPMPFHYDDRGCQVEPKGSHAELLLSDEDIARLRRRIEDVIVYDRDRVVLKAIDMLAAGCKSGEIEIKLGVTKARGATLKRAMLRTVDGKKITLPTKPPKRLTDDQILDAVKATSSKSEAAEKLGVSYQCVRRRLIKL